VHIVVCTSVHVVNRQIRVKIGQNGVKIVSKSGQKRAQIVMPILTFWVWTPSGASARAVLALPKGKKARLGGAKWRPQKLSTISTSAQVGAAGQSLPPRPVESSTCGGQPPRHHRRGERHTGDTQAIEPAHRPQGFEESVRPLRDAPVDSLKAIRPCSTTRRRSSG
jgi:hypothetical protein